MIMIIVDQDEDPEEFNRIQNKLIPSLLIELQRACYRLRFLGCGGSFRGGCVKCPLHFGGRTCQEGNDKSEEAPPHQG